MARVTLRTAAWYGDHQVELDLPEAWDASVFSPSVGPVLTDAEIWERLERPVGQRPIRDQCSAGSRPLIIVDDLNRPTPAARVLPLVIRQFTEAGVPTQNITIVIGPGTHAPPKDDAVAKKVGADLLQSCRVLVHHSGRPVVKLGRTSFGTPVLVPRELLTSDFVVAIGGIYPNHTGGFGGGSKAALGILGLRSIAALHFGHDSVGWGSRSSNDTFRSDLNEIAELIGLRTGVFVGIDAEREVVDVVCGDIRAVYGQVLTDSTARFRAPPPDPATRIVISNAYPSDLSLTFVQMKGMFPFRFARPDASRIVVASCNEGLGFHGLFPFMNAPRLHRYRMLRHRIGANINKPRRLVSKGVPRVVQRLSRNPRASGLPATSMAHPTWLYCPSPASLALLPREIPGIRVTSSWSEVVNGVTQEQNSDSPLRTFVYAAAALQWLA